MLFSKLNLTKFFYISSQQNLLIPLNKLSYFPDSPGHYHNHKPTSGYDQETITIIDPARIDLKNKLSYFSIAQETITIIGPARIVLKNKLSYFQIAQETIIIIDPNSPQK